MSDPTPVYDNNPPGEVSGVPPTFDNTQPSAVSGVSPTFNNAAPDGATSPAPSFDNSAPQSSMVSNGTFNTDITGWSTGAYGGGTISAAWNAGGWLDATVTVAAVNNQVRHTVDAAAVAKWAVGDRLTIKFRAKADAATELEYIQIANNLKYFVNSGSPPCVLGTDWADYEFDVTLTAPLPTGIITFNIKSDFTGVWSLDDVFMDYATSPVGTAPSDISGVAPSFNNTAPSGVSVGPTFDNTPPSTM